MRDWLPKSIVCLQDYSWRKFASDVLAGVTVGLVALPLAMAFAIASGVPPQAGLYCAIVAGFLISALGGSTTQIGGPTGAFVVVVFGIVAKYGLDGLFMCTLMAGVILVVLGATGLGTAVKFIPRPVVVGFTNGIAVIIASTQIKDFFGIKVDNVPGEFLGRMEVLARNFRSFSPLETGLGILSLVVILVFMRFVKRVPGYIVALFAGTALVMLFKLPVETIGTRFGGIPSGFPGLKIPRFHVDLLRPLVRARDYGGHAGSDRILDDGGRFRSHERRQAQSQRGAGGSRRRQHLLAALWRPARNRRDRAHRHEHPLRRQDARRRNGARADAAGDCLVRRSAGPLHSAVGIGGDPAWSSPTTWENGVKSRSF